MAVTDREMSSTTHAEFLPTVWADDTKDAIEYQEVLSKLVNTSYEDELSIGRILSIPLRANYNTQTKTEGVSNTINFQSVPGSAANNQDVTVSTHEYAAALLNAVVAAQSKYDERQRIAHGLGYALMRGVEITISTLFQSFSQIVGTLGADVTEANLRRSWQYLRDAGVTENAAWIFGPAAVASMFGMDKLTSKDFSNASPAFETASLPNILSYPGYVSNLLRAPAAGQTECALLHKEAIILLRQVKPTVREQFLIRNLADGIVAYDLYTAVEAVWVAEAPAGDSDPTQGDYGAVLIRSA
mgnify:CR=1 FL=1